MSVSPQDIQNGLPWRGDLSIALAQLLCQIRQRLLDQPSRMGRMSTRGFAHNFTAARLVFPRSVAVVKEIAKSPASVSVIAGPVGRLSG